MKLYSLVLLATIMLLIGGSAMAQSSGGDVYSGYLSNGGCTPGAEYDPACDVNHDDTIDIYDIQLTAGHWNETGTWTIELHDHDDRYYTELELQSPAAAIVHWDNLISVPAGLHDGDDDRLADLSCADGQIIKWDEFLRQWVCSDDLALLEARIAALEDLLQDVSRIDNDIYLTGVNLHVVNGAGSTETTNSLGNVIIGYNEQRSPPVDRTGSHMLVVGIEHSYSSYGGIVVGQGNITSDPYASVSGGYYNTASGPYASVSGGSNSTASGNYSSVSGGYTNQASGYYSSVSGGYIRSVGGSYDWRAGGLFEDF
jgi:hypothetical protein